MKPKLIKSKADHKAALSRVEALMESDPAPGSEEEEELGLWALVVDDYEEARFPIDPPDPVEAILFRMDQMGLRPADLTAFGPSKSRISEVLNRKRALSLSMIRAFSEGLDIPAEILVREPEGKYRVRKKKAP